MLRAGPSPDGAMRARPGNAEDESLRERLGEFRALLVISLLMTESVGEDQILDLAASGAPVSAVPLLRPPAWLASWPPWARSAPRSTCRAAGGHGPTRCEASAVYSAT